MAVTVYYQYMESLSYLQWWWTERNKTTLIEVCETGSDNYVKTQKLELELIHFTLKKKKKQPPFLPPFAHQPFKAMMKPNVAFSYFCLRLFVFLLFWVRKIRKKDRQKESLLHGFDCILGYVGCLKFCVLLLLRRSFFYSAAKCGQ